MSTTEVVPEPSNIIPGSYDPHPELTAELLAKRAAVLKPKWANILAELKQFDKWVPWSFTITHGKIAKEPYFINEFRRASKDKPEDWLSFEEARAFVDSNGYDGVWFVLTEDDPYCAVDLDNVVSGSLQIVEPYAERIVKDLDSYTELSPSGNGYRVLVRAEIPRNINKPNIEMYQTGFISVTGHVSGSVLAKPIADRGWRTRGLFYEFVGDTDEATFNLDFDYNQDNSPLTQEDHALRAKMFASKNGDKIKRLYDGDNSMHDGDESRADLALCGELAWWSNYSVTTADRWFRHSNRMRPKWDEVHYANGDTYGAHTLRVAFGDRKPGDGYRGSAQADTLAVEIEKTTRRQFRKWHGRDKQTISPHKMLLGQPYNIPLGMVSSVYSLPGVGKSTVASYLAVTTCMGLPFLGTPIEAGNVFYLDFETDQNFLVQRVNEVARGLDLNPDVLDGKFFYYSFEGEGVFIPDVLDDVMSWVHDYTPRLILIDSYQRAFGKNPSDAEQVTKQMGYLTTLAVQSGAAVVFLDHTSKPQKDHISDTMFGSQYKTSFSRSAHKLTATDDPDVLEWRTTKTNMRKGDPVGIRVEHGNEFNDDNKTVRFSKADIVFNDASTKDQIVRVSNEYLEHHIGREVLLTELIENAVRTAGVSDQHARNIVTEWLEPIVKTGGIKVSRSAGKGRPKAYLLPSPW